jgi:hypothetical protein
VPREEVAAVLKSALDALRTSSLDRNALRHVVTIVAVRFFVTRATELSISSSFVAVTSREASLVLQKGDRKRKGKIPPLVTGGALPLLPLLRVLVTGEALLHRR